MSKTGSFLGLYCLCAGSEEVLHMFSTQSNRNERQKIERNNFTRRNTGRVMTNRIPL